MRKLPIETESAPAAIGPYSQAIRTGTTLYLSGQIPLDPETGDLVPGDFGDRVRQVFDNLRAVCRAAGGDLDDLVKITVYLTDLGRFAELNAIMSDYFQQPYPARAAVEVRGLPRAVDIEMDAIAVLTDD